MLELNFNPFPELVTERLVLRSINEDDAREILFFRSDDRVMKYINRPIAKTIEDALKWIRLITEAGEKNDSVTWGITLKGEKKLIGNISFWRMDKENYRAEIGYMLHPDFHGKRIMQEAMATVLKYGFEVMKLHSVEANVNPDNAASIKLLVRNGFMKEAYFRENYYFEGRFLDSAIYSLLTPIKN